MIYIKESFPNSDSVTIEVDGILDHESITALQEICDRHLKDEKRVTLHLGKLIHISREGNEFLHHMQYRVIVQGLQSA